MPDFSLRDVVTGRLFGRGDCIGKCGTLVVFLCRHCPYVVHMREELVNVANFFAPFGFQTVAISSNDPVAYPEDSPESLREMAVAGQFSFPLLFDETQSVARAFGAECTPDIFLYGAGLQLYYRGRLDESTPGNGKPITGSEIRAAISALLAGQAAPINPLPSIGCSIKWRRPHK